MPDRRGCTRHRTYLGARIEFDSGFLTANCLVRDAGEHGARLTLSPAVILPQEFVLHLPKKQQNLHVRLAWRSDDECGVEFLKKHEQYRSILRSTQ